GVIMPQQGLRVLEQLLAQERPHVAVMPVEWGRYGRQFEPGRGPSWLSRVVREALAVPGKPPPATNGQQSAATPGSFMQQLQAAPPNQQREMLLNHIHDQVVKVIGLARGQVIDPRQPLNELGLDSLMAVELRNLLGAS